MLLVWLVARRFGHAVGGAVAGLPMMAGPIVGFPVWPEPPAAVGAVALASIACLPATAVQWLAFASRARRWHWAVIWRPLSG